MWIQLVPYFLIALYTINPPNRPKLTSMQTIPTNQIYVSLSSCPGTCTFNPHRPVLRRQHTAHFGDPSNTNVPVITLAGSRTVPSAVIRESTLFIWLFASVMSIEICAR